MSYIRIEITPLVYFLDSKFGIHINIEGTTVPFEEKQQEPWDFLHCGRRKGLGKVEPCAQGWGTGILHLGPSDPQL